jgi:hypothetical protein
MLPRRARHDQYSSRAREQGRHGTDRKHLLNEAFSSSGGRELSDRCLELARVKLGFRS